MIKFLKILVAVIIILVAVAVYLLFFRKSNDQVLSKIPGTSASIMVIDVRALSKKLLLDDLGKGLKSSTKSFARLLPDSTANIDWSDNGLGLPDKLALFTLEDSAEVKLHMIAPLSNAKRFEQFIKILGVQMKFTIHQKGGIQWAFAKNPGILLAWNDQFACGLLSSHYTNDDLNTLNSILSCKPHQSIMADTCFVRQLASEFDVMVYSRKYRKCSVKKLEILNDNMDYGVSFIRFNAGEIMVNATIKPKSQSALSKLFIGTNDPMPVLVNKSHAPISFSLQVNPTIFRQLFNQYKPIDVTTNLSGYPDTWDGRLALVLNGTKTFENKYTTYEYDDNFNKIAITKLKKDSILDIQLVAGTLNDKVRNIHPIISGKDTLLFTGGNMILKKAGQFFVIYNKSCTKPMFTETPNRNQMEIAITYPQLSPILKGIGLVFKTAYPDSVGINKIIVTVHQSQTIDIASSFSFMNTKRNSFYTVLEKIPIKGF